MSNWMHENTRREPVLDYSLSVKVADLIQAEKYRCWYNACKAMIQLPGLFLFASYTEGWLVVPKEHEVQVIEHGWVTRTDKRVVDPSIVLLEEEDQELTYFPALHFSWFQLQALPENILLPLAHLLSPTQSELGAPDYRAAYDAALAYAEQLANATGKRVQVCPKETMMVIVTREGTIVIIS
jgi:hypothetical protein